MGACTRGATFSLKGRPPIRSLLEKLAPVRRRKFVAAGRAYSCRCGRPVFFRNSVCLACGAQLGYEPQVRRVFPLAPGSEPGAWRPEGQGAPDRQYRRCANLESAAGCNWLFPEEDAAANPRQLCCACRLNRTIPDLSKSGNSVLWGRLEEAKRRLVSLLVAFDLPVASRVDQDTAHGLAFDFLQSPAVGPRVLTGYMDGVITVNIEEADNPTRERIREQMHEPYRTLLGHFRHEVGHYYYYRLVAPSTEYVARFNELYGDPDADYQAALDRHYSEGAPQGWKKKFVSSYATMHAAEDWAETFAHYLHIRDTLDTSAWCGLAPATATFDRPALGPSAFPNIIDLWLPLSWSLNMVNRSMGHDDLYPFVLPAAVLEKMQFIHTVIEEVTAALSGKPDPVVA